MLLSRIPLSLAVIAGLAGPAAAKDLQNVGISVGSLGNPFFVATIKGIEDRAKKINPNVKVTAVSSDYDLNKQFTQIDNFIASGTNVIMLNAVDPVAIAPSVKRAQAAGIVVAAFDVAASGADVTVMTDNVKAGAIACQYLVDHLKGKGDVLIVNGPQVSSVTDRVKGCKEVFAKHPDIKILSDNQDAKGSREGGFAVAQSLLTRFPKVDAIFAINDPTAIGVSLAAKQLNRSEFIITAVDGAPDIEQELKSGTSLIKASASQDPYVMAGQSLELAAGILNGKKPEKNVILLEPKLITSQNVNEYKGWTAAR
ncbi:ABC transporter substrate-binding protein [Microvirga arsenatis]|uniref:Substrate-binding domain-containing protein n=1 Tax=Microvirga arsenatis TaxID=2692265 RepID=A0ABW9YXZ0_9HYPH|nr:ABC transporter substrate-binding protein [Microvirga arsenatis]NBJ11662.1 substrate-binding domain-containing protein [Microvirga arsenatis]NBJ24943.1 substrate-binding domain-containing protein [Microvirga arsenatis]